MKSIATSESPGPVLIVALIAIAAASLLLACSVETSATRDSGRLALEITELLEERRYSDLAALMDYPVSLSDEEKRAEMVRVEESLKLLTELFQLAKIDRNALHDAPAYTIGVSAGSLEDADKPAGEWSRHSYPARFSDGLEGTIGLDLVWDGRSWKCRRLTFGIDKGQERALERSVEIRDRVIRERTSADPSVVEDYFEDGDRHD